MYLFYFQAINKLLVELLLTIGILAIAGPPKHMPIHRLTKNGLTNAKLWFANES